MASNVSSIDGMGFEEVNQDQSFTETISGTNIYGDNAWINGTIEATIISGAQIVDVDGQLISASYQNTADVYGQRVRAGSVLIGDHSSGLIAFADDWVGLGNYFITISPHNWTLPVASNTSGTGFSISGVRTASQCWAYGPSGTVADWIAVGY